MQWKQGWAAHSHGPAPQQADVGPRKDAAPLGSCVVEVEIKTLEPSRNNGLQEVPWFGVASGPKKNLPDSWWPNNKNKAVRQLMKL